MLVYQRVYHLPTSLKWEEKTHTLQLMKKLRANGQLLARGV
jgi:hypothetical protein